MEKEFIETTNIDTRYKEKLIEESKKEYKEIIDNANIESKQIIEKANKKKETIIEEAENKKETLLESAYEKSKSILEQSKEKGYNEGYEEGHAKGYSEGYAKGEKSSEKLIKEALDIKEGYLKERKNLLQELEKDIIELVSQIYEKIIREKSEEDSEVIVSLVLNGIDSLDITDKLTIITSEEDHNIVEMSKDIILAKASMISELDIKYDSTMQKGDCILETPKGNVDVSLRNQLSEVREILYSVLNNE